MSLERSIEELESARQTVPVRVIHGVFVAADRVTQTTAFKKFDSIIERLQTAVEQSVGISDSEQHK